MGGLVNIHFHDSQTNETYYLCVHSQKLGEQLLDLYAHYIVDYWEQFVEHPRWGEAPLSFDRWVMDFCGCRCVRVACIHYEISEEMFD